METSSIKSTTEYETMEEIWAWLNIPIRDEVKKSRILDIIYDLEAKNWVEGWEDCHEAHYIDTIKF